MSNGYTPAFSPIAASALEDDSLPSWQVEHRFRLVGHVLVDRTACPGAGLEAVVVADEDAARGEARIEELDRIERRLVEVDVDVDQAELIDLGVAEDVRDPASVQFGPKGSEYRSGRSFGRRHVARSPVG